MLATYMRLDAAFLLSVVKFCLLFVTLIHKSETAIHICTVSDICPVLRHLVRSCLRFIKLQSAFSVENPSIFFAFCFCLK